MKATFKKPNYPAHSSPSGYKARSGLTLVELVVAIAITTIVMGSIVTIAVLLYQSYDINSHQAEAQNLGVLTLQRIKDKVRYAETVTIYDSKTAAVSAGTGTPVYYDTDKDSLSIGGDTYLENAFKAYDCTIKFEAPDKTPDGTSLKVKNFLQVTITLKYKSKQLYTSSSGFYLINMVKSSITDQTTDPDPMTDPSKQTHNAITFVNK